MLVVIYSILAIVFVLCMIGMYLVTDYRNGVIYNGFVGKIQKLLNQK